jgi:ParB family chromosome partitioning protein
MAMKGPRLGRGIDALLGGSADDVAEDRGSKDGSLRQIALDLLQRGKYQPRSHMDKEALTELADSIRQQGVVQPIVVRPIGEGRYEIVAGERRWRAAQQAGLDRIPALVRDIPDEAAIAVALIENIQRENLNPIEEAHALQRLANEFSLTQEQVAEQVGRSRTGVTNLIRLLNLNSDVRQMLELGQIDMGHGRALLSLEGQAQSRAAKEIVSRGLSVREAEALVRQAQSRQGKPTAAGRAKPDADVADLQRRLSEKLGASVSLNHTRSGKGKLIIAYNSLDELDGILQKIK